MMFPEQLSPLKVIESVAKWFEIAEENNYSIPRDRVGFYIYATKSALLKRLLNGKEPFPFPPPRSFSYPWYSLIENGRCSGFLDVHLCSDTEHLSGKLLINQYSWHLVEKKSDHNYVVTYNPNEGSVWELVPMSVDEIYALRRKSTIPSRSDERVMQDSIRDRYKFFHMTCVKSGKNTTKYI